MLRLLSVVAAFTVLAACEYDDSCDRLADYVCSCHPEDTDACDGYLALAEYPSSDELDQCVVDLADLKDQDESEGLVCEV